LRRNAESGEKLLESLLCWTSNQKIYTWLKRVQNTNSIDILVITCCLKICSCFRMAILICSLSMSWWRFMRSLLLNRGAVSCLFQVNSRISDSVGAANGNWNRSLRFENILFWTLKKIHYKYVSWIGSKNKSASSKKFHGNQIVMFSN
jgi:hypothetical protein